jgi:tRNA threonylcarbamoyladenosine biosynthesis protein TsaB
MLIMTLRTDKPESELGLYDNETQLAYYSWQAHRQLAETLHTKIKELLESKGKSFDDIEGIIAFRGPGSFTGLRIGLTVANTLAEGLGASIVAENGDDWIAEGCRRLANGENEHIALPEYGSAPLTTQPKK